MEMTNKIPKFIIRKLKLIEQHQRAVKKLINDIENWRPILAETTDENNWTFSMYIDQQGDIVTVKESLELLKYFLDLAKQRRR